MPWINSIPSVGSRPTCRIGKAIVSNSMLGPLPSLYTSQEAKKDKVHVTSLKYNTITNPLPLLTQNPYINQEITMAAHKIGKAD